MQRDIALIARNLFSDEPDRRIEAGPIETLVRFGAGALSYALDGGIRVNLLKEGETYRRASAALLRLGIDVDAWPSPPAGLFVVEERTVYLRSRSPMTVAHEFSHALDCALGGGVYRSGVDPRIRAMFGNASAFVTPYAATGIDEYFAESIRAYVGINDPSSVWPRATRERLRRLDPEMHDYVGTIFRTEFSLAA
ncbi:MAG: hypothetical protein JO241_01975 [Candidatus Eremiobacteraeota bacterium]|nr:hypothetical protein [Candidatus Eremiobacteraeota bacterium]MBV8582737.1 hypothetical protein [Candidatus Eremiobacteraeota bacterium]